MWYKIDINKWAVLQLPTRWRQPKMIALLTKLVYPFKTLFSEFLIKRDEDIFLLTHNAQVCYLRKAINDYFDSEQRRIYITNGNKYNHNYLYTRIENKPIVGTVYLHRRSDYSDTGVDYIVFVPSDILSVSELELISLIDKFNVATRRYKLESI